MILLDSAGSIYDDAHGHRDDYGPTGGDRLLRELAHYVEFPDGPSGSDAAEESALPRHDLSIETPTATPSPLVQSSAEPGAVLDLIGAKASLDRAEEAVVFMVNGLPPDSVAALCMSTVLLDIRAARAAIEAGQ